MSKFIYIFCLYACQQFSRRILFSDHLLQGWFLIPILLIWCLVIEIISFIFFVVFQIIRKNKNKNCLKTEVIYSITVSIFSSWRLCFYRYCYYYCFVEKFKEYSCFLVLDVGNFLKYSCNLSSFVLTIWNFEFFIFHKDHYFWLYSFKKHSNFSP